MFIPRGDNEVQAIRETIDLIEGQPADIKLLRQELQALKHSFYYFSTISDLRRYLDSDFEASFFSRANKRFFGDSKYKWSKKYQRLTIEKSTGTAIYEPVMTSEGKIELRCV
jgi:hypothetical protein